MQLEKMRVSLRGIPLSQKSPLPKAKYNIEKSLFHLYLILFISLQNKTSL